MKFFDIFNQSRGICPWPFFGENIKIGIFEFCKRKSIGFSALNKL